MMQTNAREKETDKEQAVCKPFRIREPVAVYQIIINQKLEQKNYDKSALFHIGFYFAGEYGHDVIADFFCFAIAPLVNAQDREREAKSND